jgi:hypothetical protein
MSREATAWISLLEAGLTSKEHASQNLQLGDWYKTLEEIKQEEAAKAVALPSAEVVEEVKEAPGQPGKPPGPNSTRDG